MFFPDLADADACYSTLGDLMRQAVASAKLPWHLPYAATVGEDGGPRVRTVVLRRFDAAGRAVHFHTDARSPKVEQLRRDPRVELVFYDGPNRLQARLPCLAELHHADELCREVWAGLTPSNRATYNVAEAPSSELTIDASAYGPAQIGADVEEVFLRFVIVRCVFDAAEVLELHHTGHRRARLEWDRGAWRTRRLAP